MNYLPIASDSVALLFRLLAVSAITQKRASAHLAKYIPSVSGHFLAYICLVQCGLEQMCWEPFESPWVRHAFLSADCIYVERIKAKLTFTCKDDILKTSFLFKFSNLVVSLFATKVTGFRAGSGWRQFLQENSSCSATPCQPQHHRIIIPRWAKCFIIIDIGTFYCPVLGSRHCTCQNRTSPAGIDPPLYSQHFLLIYGHANYTAADSWFNYHRRRDAPPPFPT